MKVCILRNHSYDPPETFTLSKAQVLDENGFEVTIIGIGNNIIRHESVLNGNILIRRVRGNGIYTSPFVGILNPFTLASVLSKALHEKADLYYCCEYAMLPVAFMLKILSKRVIHSVEDDDPSNFSYVIRNHLRLGFIATMAEKVFRHLEHIAIKRVDYVVTLTESLRKDRLKYNQRIKAIYYCIDPVFHPNNTDNNLVERFRDYKIIIYSGTINPKKGSMEILDAFNKVKKRVPNALLLMVGASSPKSNDVGIKRFSSKIPDVIITGWLPYTDMPKYICLGKVGLAIVKPANYSYRISVPYKLLEQMACGLPVIAPKGLPEVERIVRSAECGLLVDVNDPSKIADAVVQLLQDEKTRSAMGENARNYILQNHSLETMEKEFMEICHSVLGGSPSAL